MTKSEAMVARLQENFDGTPWHGTSLRRILDGVDDARAHAHPIANTRSIAELLGHTIAWIEIVDRRLRGEDVKITPELDFPDVSGQSWSSLLSRLETSFQTLIATVRSIDDFEQMVNGKKYSMRYMLNGVMHHNTYHAAQMVMLKKL